MGPEPVGPFVNRPVRVQFESPFLADLVDDAQQAFEVRTSGSTGEPKTVLVPKAKARLSALATGEFLGLKPGDRALLAVDPEPIAGRMMLVRALVLGLELHACPPEALPSRPRADEEFAFTALFPRQVEELLSRNPERMRRMGTVLIGGGPLSPELDSRLAEWPNPVWHSFGMTETLSHVALRRPGELLYRALPGVTFDTHDGCLQIDAPQALERPLLTTDLVELESPTTFRWLGRADFAINTGGLKVLPEVLEAELAPQIDGPFAVFGLPDRVWGERIVLACTQKPGPLRTRDPRHMPKQIVVVGQIPLTRTGKPDRPALRRLLGSA